MVNPDGVSYLDMADAFNRRGMKELVNAYWSPLYPGLLGIALRILRPSRIWDAPVAHLVNFLIFVGVLACFSFFWRNLRDWVSATTLSSSQPILALLPAWSWTLLGYVVFLWSTLQFISLSIVTPDLCVAAFVFLEAGLALRIAMRSGAWIAYLIFGLVLGGSYLAKVAMLPVAFVFLGVSLFMSGNMHRAAPRLLVSLLALLTVAAPLVIVLSRAEGRFTYGESGKLNYANYVNGYAGFGSGLGWQGQPPGSGLPAHPVQIILNKPTIIGYAAHVTGTYPFWYDPAYWEDGMEPHFDLRAQARVLTLSMVGYFHLGMLQQEAFIVAVIMLVVLSGSGGSFLRKLTTSCILWIPAVAAMGMYALVLVEGRYVGPYFVLFWAAMLSSIRMPASSQSRRVAVAAAIAISVCLGMQICDQVVMGAIKEIGDQEKVQFVVADDLKMFGVNPGDYVALAGDGFNAYWARVARVSIIAEAPDRGTGSFWWATDAKVKGQVFAAFASTGAKLLVADREPCTDWRTDWKRIGTTSYYMHPLVESEN